MKYLIASDIHGSAFWCHKLLERFVAEQADGLWLLGDVLYHGPRNDLPEEYSPKKVIAMLNPLSSQIVCVRGNCDAEVDQMVLDFPIMDETRQILWPAAGPRPGESQFAAGTGPQPGESQFAAGTGPRPGESQLAAGAGFSPDKTGLQPTGAAKAAEPQESRTRILLTHGHHINKDTLSLPETKERYGALDCDVLIYGHFHVPLKTRVGHVWCLNPGSVSIPKENSPHSYMVFEDGGFFWKDMEGNVYDSLPGKKIYDTLAAAQSVRYNSYIRQS